ncbi:hypothetical protein HGA64_00830 [Candidatus Falkowbacteria bacterium]|nr:hypothetical protein [Candidatus Falkowbacteria bacterium]
MKSLKIVLIGLVSSFAFFFLLEWLTPLDSTSDNIPGLHVSVTAVYMKVVMFLLPAAVIIFVTLSFVNIFLTKKLDLIKYYILVIILFAAFIGGFSAIRLYDSIEWTTAQIGCHNAEKYIIKGNAIKYCTFWNRSDAWEVVGADVATFQELGRGYAKDKNSVYHYGRKMENIDSKSFDLSTLDFYGKMEENKFLPATPPIIPNPGYLQHADGTNSDLLKRCSNDSDCVLRQVYSCNFAAINKNNLEKDVEKFLEYEKNKLSGTDCISSKSMDDYSAVCLRSMECDYIKK